MQETHDKEVDVIIGIAAWLHSNGWHVKKISIPRNQKVSVPEQKETLKVNLAKAGLSIENLEFPPDGPDIEAEHADETWRIECKGLTSGKDTTVKNNFDRAVASAVSYYTKSERIRIGIAFPEARYLKHIRIKLPKPLRQALNMWVFLYVAHDEVYQWAPDEELPQP
jgi:hypothetical protein